MDRLYEIWDKIVDWMMAHGEEPLFNLAQGFILGAVLVAAVWLAVSAYRSSRKIERLTKQVSEYVDGYAAGFAAAMECEEENDGLQKPD